MLWQSGQGRSTGRVTAQGRDPLGRWAYQTFSCRGHKSLTIITAYQVCKQTIVDGTTGQIRSLSASAQQTSMLRQARRMCSPREAFVTDLSTFIKEKQAGQSGILLMGDFNEPLNDENRGMSQLCTALDLCDVMHQILGTAEFATHVRGRERIDYVLASDWVAEAVVDGCYEPFGQRSRGDHRNIFIDFNVERLFGNKTQELGPISSCDFTSKDKASNRVYLSAKHKYCREHNFQQRLERLKTSWDPELAERLDQDFQRAGEHAAKQCAKKPRDVPYVTELAELRQRKNLLQKLISATRLKRSFDDGIAHITNQGHVGGFLSIISACRTELRVIQQKIKSMTKQAVFRRQNELQLALQDAIDRGDKQQSKTLKHRIAAERTKAMYAKLRQYRGSKKSGITRLEVPADTTTTDYNNCSSWITIDTPAEIEERLLQRNRRHFGQADGTFPTKPPFSEWCDWGASTHTAELILEGEWQSDELDKMQQSLLDHMKSRVSIDAIPCAISKEDWIGKMRSWPESTTTSPSGFHLGHSKALIAEHDIDPSTEEGQVLEQQRNDLIDWHIGLLNCALENHYSFARWKHIVNVMILKEPDDLRIHRLRVIHLYEQDYNLVLALKWRHMIQLATNQQALQTTQFGGVPGRDAVIPTLCEEFQYEISWASKRPLVHLDYDATACYDRIILSFGSLASRSYGQNQSIVFINATTLAEAKYFLKTQLGVSEQFYKHCTIYPIYGSGQGAGNSPAIWCVVSSILFETYEAKANGATFVSPDGSVHTSVYMIGFVDDTSGSVNDFTLPQAARPEHYLAKAQSDAQRWNDLLDLSGGALNPLKCSYHFLYYTFSVDGLPLLKDGSFAPTITIAFKDGNPSVPLKQLSSFKSHKTLGVQKSPHATNTGLFTALSKRNLAHSRVMARSPFTRTEAWSYYHAIYLPSICYPFPSSTLSTGYCNALQRQFKRAFLPKYGFNRNMPNAVVYGSSDYGGLGLRTLSIERGIAQLYLLLACIRSTGVPYKLASIMMSWGQFLAGTGVPILEDVHTPLPHLSPMQWVPQLRKFLSEVDCRVELEETFVPKLQRENDVFLMDSALELTASSTELKLINACRLYLQVTMLSDLVTPDGSTLTLAAIDGRIDNKSSCTYLTPYQARPGPRAWSTWRRFLQSFLAPHSARRLASPLCRWLFGGTTTIRKWFSYLSQDRSTLFVHVAANQWQEFRSTGPLFIATNTIRGDVPSTACPVATANTGPARMVLPSRSVVATQPTPPLNTFDAYVRRLPSWENLLLDLHTLVCTDVELIDYLTRPSCPLLLCSDGSAAQFQGTFGCTCATDSGQRLFMIHGPAPGYRTSSFRAESYGFLALLRFLVHFCSFSEIPLPRDLRLYTDSESLITTIHKRLEWLVEFPYSTMSADWDLQQSISSSLRLFDRMPHIQHVKGHQDDAHDYTTLPLPSQLNIDADGLASSYTYPSNVSSTLAPLVTGSRAILHCQDGTITSKYRSILRRLSTFERSSHYLCNKFNWSNETFNSVDWVAHGRAINANFPLRHFIIKYIHDWLPLGHLRSRYASFYQDSCPLCPTTLETWSHFLRCPHRQWSVTLFSDLDKLWNSLHADPTITLLLSECLRSWLQDTSPSISLVSSVYQRALLSQITIGIDQLFMGRFSSHWSRLQDQFLRSQGISSPKFSGVRLVSSTITVLWHHAHRLWLQRNQNLHGDNPATIEAAAYSQAQREVRALYLLKPQVNPSDTILFYDSPEIHLTFSTTSIQLRNWLNTWRPVILRSAHPFP